MSRTAGMVALLGVAVLLLVVVVGLHRPVRVELAGPAESMSAAPKPVDGGTIDGLLDAIQLDHLLKHGR